MSELFFVVKSVALTVILILGMQIQVGGSTVERHFFNWIHSSSVGNFLTNVARGGNSLVSNGTQAAVDFAAASFSGSNLATGVSKAGRFDFETKKNQAKKQTDSED